MWLVAVITGRNPQGLHNGLMLGLGYQAKALAYLMLLTETWPPFSDGDTGEILPAR